jgi:radical SAM superfamily enzyme YgiQ (UPF0313 family)
MNESISQKKIIIFEPPHGRAWDIPFGTLPALTGSLRLCGYQVDQYDLNTLLFLDLLEKVNIDEILLLLSKKISFIENRLEKKRGGILAKLKRLILRNRFFLPLLKKIYFNFVSHDIAEKDKSYSSLLKLKTSKRKILLYYQEILTLREKWEKEIAERNFNYSLFYNLNKSYRFLLDAIEQLPVVYGKNADFYSAVENKEYNFYYKFYEPYLKIIDKENASVVGISATLDNKLAALTLAGMIRKRCPQVHIVMGGMLFHYAHFNDQYDRSDLKHLLKDYTHSIVIGEGESAIREIIEALSLKRDWASVTNLVWMDGEELKFNKPFRYENIDKIYSYDFEGLPLKYYSGLPVEVNRGCYWDKCSFCHYFHHHHYREKYKEVYYRKGDTDKIVNQIRLLKNKYGVKNFEFTCLDISPVEARNLCNALIDEKLDIRWNARVRLDKTFTPDLFHLMSRSGVAIFMFYPETFSSEVASLQNKNYDIGHVKSLIKYWNEHKEELPPLVVKLMTGFPGEKLKDFLETFRYVKKNSLTIHNIGLFRMAKGSEIFYNPEKFGLEIVSSINRFELFHHFRVKWSDENRRERMKIERWIFNNHRKWKKYTSGWSKKYKAFHDE